MEISRQDCGWCRTRSLAVLVTGRTMRLARYVEVSGESSAPRIPRPPIKIFVFRALIHNRQFIIDVMYLQPTFGGGC